jgi:hypothetical protein
MTNTFSWRRGVLRVETCAGSWLIDVPRSRYCRVDRATAATFLSPRAWKEFHRLIVGAGGLVRLVLDTDGVSFISGRLHSDDCDHCGAQPVLRRPA